MNDVLQRIADAGGRMMRRGRGWSYGDVYLTRSEVRRLFAARMVERVGDNCIALTALAKSHCGNAGRGPMRGACIDYQIDGHCERGRVLIAGAYQATVWALGPRAGQRRAKQPGGFIFQRGPIHMLRRPRVSAPWKFASSSPIGTYRPEGGNALSAVVWPDLVAEGHVPAAWFAPPEGAPATLTRLVSVARRLASIGASPVSVEERAAAEVCLTGGATWRAPNLANVRTALRRLGRDVQHARQYGQPDYGAAGVIAYLERFAANHPSEVFGADVTVMRERVCQALSSLYNQAMREARGLPAASARGAFLRARCPPFDQVRPLLVEWGDDPAEEVMIAAYHAEIARVEHDILRSYSGLRPFGEDV